MFVAFYPPLYYLEQVHQLAIKNHSDVYKKNFSERNIISKHFQRCDSYCLVTQINFKHVSELGNLTLERLALFKVK